MENKLYFDFTPIVKPRYTIPVMIQGDDLLFDFQVFVKIPASFKCVGIEMDPAFKQKSQSMSESNPNNYLNEAVVVAASAYGTDVSAPTKIADITVEPVDATIVWDKVNSLFGGDPQDPTKSVEKNTVFVDLNLYQLPLIAPEQTEEKAS